MAAALELGRAGYKTYLVEKEPTLGGGMRDVHPQPGDESFAELQNALQNMQEELSALDKVEVLTGTRLVSFSGYVGNFTTTVKSTTANGVLATRNTFVPRLAIFCST